MVLFYLFLPSPPNKLLLKIFRCYKENINEDEKLKEQLFYIAYVCSQIGKFPLLFNQNSHLLLSYVILRQLFCSVYSIVSFFY